MPNEIFKATANVAGSVVTLDWRCANGIVLSGAGRSRARVGNESEPHSCAAHARRHSVFSGRPKGGLATLQKANASPNSSTSRVRCGRKVAVGGVVRTFPEERFMRRSPCGLHRGSPGVAIRPKLLESLPLVRVGANALAVASASAIALRPKPWSNTLRDCGQGSRAYAAGRAVIGGVSCAVRQATIHLQGASRSRRRYRLCCR